MLKAIALAHRGKDVNNQMIMTTKAQKLYCAIDFQQREEKKVNWNGPQRPV